LKPPFKLCYYIILTLYIYIYIYIYFLFKAGSAWKLKTGHWAAPNWPPKPNKIVKEYIPPDPPDIGDRMVNQMKSLFYHVRVKMYGRRCATKLQSVWRKYLLYKEHVRVKNARKVQIRAEKVVVIQAQMRRFLGARRASQRLVTQLKLISWVSARYRGRKLRKTRRENNAALKITKFIKSIKSIKFRETGEYYFLFFLIF